MMGTGSTARRALTVGGAVLDTFVVIHLDRSDGQHAGSIRVGLLLGKGKKSAALII